MKDISNLFENEANEIARKDFDSADLHILWCDFIPNGLAAQRVGFVQFRKMDKVLVCLRYNKYCELRINAVPRSVNYQKIYNCLRQREYMHVISEELGNPENPLQIPEICIKYPSICTK